MPLDHDDSIMEMTGKEGFIGWDNSKPPPGERPHRDLSLGVRAIDAGSELPAGMSGVGRAAGMSRAAAAVLLGRVAAVSSLVVASW